MRKLSFILLGFILIGSNYFSQNASASSKNLDTEIIQKITDELIFETLPSKEKEKIISLKKKYQEKFQKVLRKKLEKQREFLKKLKKENPEKFREIVKEAKRRIRERLERIRRKNPEKFKELMRKRRALRRKMFEKLCKENPQKCKEILKRRLKRLKKHLEELKRKNPQRYEKVMKRLKRVKRDWGWRKNLHNDGKDHQKEKIHLISLKINTNVVIISSWRKKNYWKDW